eukprot:NODE_25294_length_592_cov_2.105376.p1 GENE.NODE_25294_length_592_cov_2.105376~~NODE_25294_length_592_cov_2.105376.p1  ORF type:complete len:145 (-),score=5.07 NODE_25294_length_592_cov_2.105376:46-480(-)
MCAHSIVRDPLMHTSVWAHRGVQIAASQSPSVCNCARGDTSFVRTLRLRGAGCERASGRLTTAGDGKSGIGVPSAASSLGCGAPGGLTRRIPDGGGHRSMSGGGGRPRPRLGRGSSFNGGRGNSGLAAVSYTHLTLPTTREMIH